MSSDASVAAGSRGGLAPLEVTAAVGPVGDEFEIEASATVDQRELGMTWSPLGMLRAPSRLLVRGRLVRDQR